MPSFTQDVSKFVEKTKANGGMVLRKLAFDAFAGVLRKSPVDTGRFRSNWRIGINRFDLTLTAAPLTRDPLSGRFVSKGFTRGSSPSGVEAAQGYSSIATAKWGDYVAITNNLHYGPRLENGYSKQAPTGMVKVTFEEVKAGVAKAVAALP
jgi:hypothetical protein